MGGGPVKRAAIRSSLPDPRGRAAKRKSGFVSARQVRRVWQGECAGSDVSSLRGWSARVAALRLLEGMAK